MTCWVQVFWLPWMSVTVQMTALVPAEYGSVASLMTPATAQLSEVTGLPRLTPLAVHRPLSVLTVTSVGQRSEERRVGKARTCWVQVFWLPWMSVTVQMTALVPAGYGSVASLMRPAKAQLAEVTG